MIGRSTGPPPVVADASPRQPCDGLQRHFRAMLRSLHWPEEGGNENEAGALGTLGLTSCSRSEGVSTIAAQLAVAAARVGGGPVLLLDTNLTRPAVHELFDVDLGPGLAEALLNPGALPTWVQPSGFENLSVLTAGEPNSKLPRAFDTAGMDVIIRSVRREYALVVFDLPPAGQEGAAVRLAGLLDAVVLVVEAERVGYEVARRTRELLERAGANVRGAVLNKRREYVPWWLRRAV